MASSNRTTIVVTKAGYAYKICKIWFGSDGSYYVTSPYHRSGQAVLIKATVAYGRDSEQMVPLSDLIDIASLEDGDRLKLSHHPDGFCQFSGKGIYSGKNTDGSMKGVGVQARALHYVPDGPTFILTVNAIEKFEPYKETQEPKLVFDYDKLVPISGNYGFRLEGHYLQPEYRRFVQTHADGSQWISLIHPARAIMQLRTLIAPATIAIPAVIAFDFFPSPVTDEHPDFVLSGPGGNLRDDPRGQNVADQLSAVYPPPHGLPVHRSVDYPQREFPIANQE